MNDKKTTYRDKSNDKPRENETPRMPTDIKHPPVNPPKPSQK